jgi:hypothetical protein
MFEFVDGYIAAAGIPGKFAGIQIVGQLSPIALVPFIESHNSVSSLLDSE